jgi:translation initiation factor 2 gamma subunit (eIF-2gamma)
MPLPRKSTHKGFKPRRARLSRGAEKLKREGNLSGVYSRLRKVGNNKHSKDWRREWPGLKRELERAGITRCERCGSDYFLTPAHSLKRRHITNRTEMREVALLCAPCHSTLELLGEAKMRPAILAIIADRPNKLTEAA